MVEGSFFTDIPEDWPGNPWLEGRTIIRLPSAQERPTHMPRGPAKRTGPGFLNPAMAPARTRSVMLLTDALEHGWIGKSPIIRAIDVMSATGIRVRRWRNEIPRELQSKLQNYKLVDVNYEETGSQIIYHDRSDRYKYYFN